MAYGRTGFKGYAKYNTVVKNTSKSGFESWLCNL